MEQEVTIAWIGVIGAVLAALAGGGVLGVWWEQRQQGGRDRYASQTQRCAEWQMHKRTVHARLLQALAARSSSPDETTDPAGLAAAVAESALVAEDRFRDELAKGRWTGPDVDLVALAGRMAKDVQEACS